MKSFLVLVFFVFGVIGCTSTIVNRTFQNPNEISANNRAEWVPISKTASGGIVYFDPYQVYFISSNTMRIPLKLPVSDTATGNWIYELNCDSTKGRFISTLGGSGNEREMDFPKGSVGYIAKEKICGRTLSGKPYSFISADTDQNEFYYSKNEVEQNSNNSNIYRFSIMNLAASGKNWSTGQIEINCKDETSRPNSSSDWGKTPKRSPANVLIYQYCKSSRLVNGKYGSSLASTPQSGDTEMGDYLSKLNNSSKQTQKPYPKTSTPQAAEPAGLPNAKKDTFDWQKLYKN